MAAWNLRRSLSRQGKWKMSNTEHVHFVEGELQEELDRLGISRTDCCVVCREEVSDEEVGELNRNKPEYDTVCKDCKSDGQ